MKDLKNIITRIKDLFSDIHVEIEKHAIIGGEYEVSCYGINEDRSDKLVSLIYDLNDELYPDYEIELIPILYTKEETREHFPPIADLLLIKSISRTQPTQKFLPSQNTEFQNTPCKCPIINQIEPIIATDKSDKKWPSSSEKRIADNIYEKAA